jgi:hypothetical protein
MKAFVVAEEELGDLEVLGIAAIAVLVAVVFAFFGGICLVVAL